MKKSTVILLIILIILLLIGGGYLYWKLVLKGMETAKTLPSPTVTSTISASPRATATTTPTASATPTSGWHDCATFSDEEKSIMTSWLTHTDDTYNYRFRYPQTWTVSSDGADLVTVRGTDSSEAVTFQVRVGAKTEIGFAEYHLTFTRDFTVNCESALENTYDGADNLTLMTYRFDKTGSPYLLMYSFKDIGASYAGDMYNLDKMILKTFAFK